MRLAVFHWYFFSVGAAHEKKSNQPLFRGLLSMANSGRVYAPVPWNNFTVFSVVQDTNGSQFFILFKPAHHLNGALSSRNSVVASADWLVQSDSYLIHWCLRLLSGLYSWWKKDNGRNNAANRCWTGIFPWPLQKNIRIILLLLFYKWWCDFLPCPQVSPCPCPPSPSFQSLKVLYSIMIWPCPLSSRVPMSLPPVP